MKHFNLQTFLVLIFSIGLTSLTNVAHTQNTWGFTQLKKTVVTDTGCRVYTYNDPEVNIEYQYAIGEDEGDNYAADIAFTKDSNFIILYLNYGSHLALYNTKGEQLWKRTLMVNEDTQFYSSNFIKIGDYYFLSGWWGDFQNHKYLGVLKTDLYGKTIWIKRNHEVIKTAKGYSSKNHIIKVEDSNFLLTNGYGVIKYDTTGNELWKITGSELGWDKYTGIIELQKSSDYTITSRYNYWKIDRNGNVLKRDSLSNGRHYTTECYNDKYYITGTTMEYFWIRRYSNSFILEKEYNQDRKDYYSGIALAADIKMLPDESILLFYDNVGWWDEDGMDIYDIDILHLDKNLNCKSIINLSAPGSQYSNELLIDSNGDYILFGDGYNYNRNRNMVMLVKLKGWPFTGIKQQKVNKLIITPNPANNLFNLQFTRPKTGILKIYNYLGSLVGNKVVNNQLKVTININEYKKGLYLIKFIDNKNQIYISKLIKN